MLVSAVDHLLEEFVKDGVFRLARLDCVLPSLYGCRRLRDLLEKTAAERNLVLEAPRFMTVGQLAEELYESSAQLAGDFEQTLAWAKALRGFSEDELQALIPVVPPELPLAPWLELAATLSSLASDLASQGYSFQQVKSFAGNDVELQRWEILSRIRDAYLEELKVANRSDASEERAKAVMEGRCGTNRVTVLVGTSDLSEELRKILRAIPDRLIAMVAAPETYSNRFDEFGSVLSDRWKDYRLEMNGEPFLPAGDMMDQSAAVAAQVRTFAGEHTSGEVTVGVTDESHVAPIEMELKGCGVQTFRNLGWPVSETSIGRLLQMMSQFINRPTWQSAAALVRHSDLHQLISSRLDEDGCDPRDSWHSQLDHLLANHFPVRILDSLPLEAKKNYPKAIQIQEFLSEWLRSFSARENHVAGWSQILITWLQGIYGEKVKDEIESTGRTSLAFAAVLTFLEKVSEISPLLDVDCTGEAALDMLTSRISFLRVVEKPSDQDVKILGWLDLALDDSPALVVNGFNHPYLPTVVSADPFLPAELRQQLPVEGNERRYARDLYSTQLILMSRSKASFVVGKVGVDQTPTPPSRLLAASKRDDLPRRMLRLLEGKRDLIPAQHRWDTCVDDAGLIIPSLDRFLGGSLPDCESQLVPSLSVTAFRDYLICPYRFFLRHVLKLRPVDDSSGELAANQFGDLIHGALELYGELPERDESDPDLIEMHLKKCLLDYVGQRYSEHGSSAVQIQIAQAEKRLGAVAKVQAKRIAEGWRIHRVEASVGPKEGACITVDGQSLPVKGRFDRIDIRVSNGFEEWAILDYKTHGHPPEKKHLKKTGVGVQWIDLQLPLYRMMVPYLGIKSDPKSVKLGYFNISSKDEETRVNEASFSEDLMSKAEELVRECVRNILAGHFEPTSERVEFDDYESIMQTGVASRLLSQTSREQQEVGA